MASMSQLSGPAREKYIAALEKGVKTSNKAFNKVLEARQEEIRALRRRWEAMSPGLERERVWQAMVEIQKQMELQFDQSVARKHAADQMLSERAAAQSEAEEEHGYEVSASRVSNHGGG